MHVLGWLVVVLVVVPLFWIVVSADKFDGEGRRRFASVQRRSEVRRPR